MFVAVFYEALDQPVMFGRFDTYSDYMLSALSTWLYLFVLEYCMLDAPCVCNSK